MGPYYSFLTVCSLFIPPPMPMACRQSFAHDLEEVIPSLGGTAFPGREHLEQVSVPLSCLLAIPLLALAAAAPQAKAITITNSAIYNPVLRVDNSTSTTQLSITGLNAPIAQVTTTIDLTKCPGTISSIGICTNTPNVDGTLTFNNEIVLILTSPTGIARNLVVANTFSGQNAATGARAVFTFSDFAPTAVGGNTLVTGTYRPVQTLSAFNNTNGNGNWTLTFRDTAARDPLGINSWSLSVRAVPLAPAAIGLAPIFGLVVLRKRFRSRNT
jgi:hypothetical protein